MTLNDLHQTLDGPIPQHMRDAAMAEEQRLAAQPRAAKLARLIQAQLEMVADYRRSALVMLIERREAWANVRRFQSPGKDLDGALWFFENADHHARREVGFYTSGRELLARFRAELDEITPAAIAA